MVLAFETYIDDSGSEPSSPIFVLGGFVASVEQWAAFSNAWRAALDEAPKLEYFKMSEAASLGAHGQFARKRGWNETKRDKRVALLTDIIKTHAALRVHASIKNSDFNEYLRSLPAFSRSLTTDHPYVFLAQQLILWTAMYQDQLGVEEPCNFIFDEQLGVSVEMAEMWPVFSALLKSRAKSDLPKFIGSQPIFRNDKSFLPLQAADLYAWHMRHFHIASERSIFIPVRKALSQLDEIPWIARDVRAAELAKLKTYYEQVGEQIAALRPDLKFVHAGKKERNKTRKAKKMTSASPSRK
jgi:hypothetical protein